MLTPSHRLLLPVVLLLGTGCLNTQLRKDLATGRVPLKIANYATAPLESTPQPSGDNRPAITRAKLQWDDHVQKRSSIWEATAPMTLRGWWWHQAPNRAFFYLLPLCDAFPDRCGWALRIKLSYVGDAAATLELVTMDDQIVETWEVCPTANKKARTIIDPAEAKAFGLDMVPGERLWLFDAPGRCIGTAGLVTRLINEERGIGELVTRFVVSRDLVLGACGGGDPIVTLRAGSYVEFDKVAGAPCCILDKRP